MGEAICWLAGYSGDGLDEFRDGSVRYGDFFRNAPQPNPNWTQGILEAVGKISWGMPAYWKGRNLSPLAASNL